MAFVVTVTVGSIRLRWADVSIEVTDGADTAEIPGFLAGVSVDESGDGGPAGGDFEVQAGPYDMASLVQSGVQLAGAKAEISEINDGGNWEARRIRVSGVLDDLTYGPAFTEFSASIVAYGEDVAKVPPVALIGSSQWADPGTAAIGEYVPMVFGAPSSTRGLIYDYGALQAVIAAHPVKATTVRTRDRAPLSGWTTRTVVNQRFTGSQLLSCATIDIPGTYTTESDIEVDWSESEGGHPVGLAGRNDAANLAILALLRYSQVPPDEGAWIAAEWLGRFRLGFFADDPVSPVELATSALSGLPVRIIAGPYGIRPIPTAGAPGIPVRMHLDCDQGGWVCSDKIMERRRLNVTQLLVNYAQDRSGAYTQSVLLNGQNSRAYARLAANAGNTFQSSVVQVGIFAQGTDILELPGVHDTATAWLAAQARAVEFWATRRVEVEGPYSAGLQPGDRVVITREDLAFDETLAHVDSVSPISADRVSVTLVLIDDPAPV